MDLKYFFSYACEDGFGNMIMNGCQKIVDEKQIAMIEEYIERTREVKGVTILYYTIMQ